MKAGDPLLQIDDTQARAGVAESKAAVSQASARVDQLRKVGAIVTSLALSAVLESHARLAAAAARLEQTRLVASRNGIILSRAKWGG